ncbi:hypothetical protein PJI16_16225 [Nitrospira sp. MA-1]|nr:hypothetical protein [Nitrospira sp. MA-1]
MMNRPETRRPPLSAPTEEEAVTDHTQILGDYSRPNSANASMDKVVKRFLIKRQEKVGT